MQWRQWRRGGHLSILCRFMADKFLTTFLLITLSLAAGYASRKLRLLPDRLANVLMTLVAVVGYPTIGLLSIWITPLKPQDAWLPALGALQMLLLAPIGLAIAARLTSDRAERGLFGITSAIGNTGLTMGGFVVFMLYGEEGLGLVSVFVATFSPMVVLLSYPMALHHADNTPGGSLGKLIIRSIFNWRSIGLPVTIVGVALSLLSVPRPAFVSELKIVDILAYGINVVAYLGIGMQLRMSFVPGMKKLIAGLAFTRFVLGALIGVCLTALTWLTPWPMSELGQKVFLIESFVSTAVTCVAVATMFKLRPREASVLFVTNTLIYLALVLPLVLWLFG